MRRLELVFQSEDKKVKTLRLNYAKEGLDTNTLQDAMKKIIDLHLFQRDGVNMYHTPIAARYVENSTDPIFDTRKVNNNQ